VERASGALAVACVIASLHAAVKSYSFFWARLTRDAGAAGARYRARARARRAYRARARARARARGIGRAV